MPAPLAVDKEAVRVLVVAVGPREAARRMNLPEGTVLAWTKRFGWLAGATMLASAITGAITPAKAAIAATLPQSMQPTVPEGHAIAAIRPADALREIQAEDSKACRSATLRFGRRTLEAAADLAEAEPLQALNLAPDVSSVVSSVAKAGNWAGDGQTNVRISVFGQAPVIDIEATVVEPGDCGTAVEPA